MIPLFLVYKPPQLLPTRVLNPIAESSETPSDSSKSKRDTSSRIAGCSMLFSPKDAENRTLWLWVSIAMISIGGIIIVCSS